MTHDYEQLVALYRDGFPKDSDRYIRFFIQSVTPGNILTYSENGRLISVGYLIDKTAELFGLRMPLPYLSAVSTRTEYRGQGIVKYIMQQAFDILYARGVTLTALYPFNHEYYRRYGYENASFCGTRIIDGRREFTARRASAADTEILSQLYAHMAHGFDGHLIYEKAEFEAMIEELKADGNAMTILSDASGDFAYVSVEKGEIVRYATKSMRKLCAANLFRGLPLPDFTLHSQAYVQLRIVNVPQFLSLPLYSAADFTWTIAVKDRMLPQNSAVYRIASADGRITVEAIHTPVSYDVAYEIGALLSAAVSGSGKFRRHTFLFPDKY